MPQTAMLDATPQLATVGRELPLTFSPPTVSKTPTPPTGTKLRHQSSDQEATASRQEEEEAVSLDVSPEGHPHQGQKGRRSHVKLLKESHQEAFKKDSDLVQNTRQVYLEMHCTSYDQEGSQDLSHTFQEMVISAGLMESEVHKVQEV